MKQLRLGESLDFLPKGLNIYFRRHRGAISTAQVLR